MRPIEETLRFGVSFELAVYSIQNKLTYREYEVSVTFVCRSVSGLDPGSEILSDQRDGVRSVLAQNDRRLTDPDDVSTCKTLLWEVVYPDQKAASALA